MGVKSGDHLTFFKRPGRLVSAAQRVYVLAIQEAGKYGYRSAWELRASSANVARQKFL